MRISILFLSILCTFGLCEHKFSTVHLKSQHNNNVNWLEYNYVIVGSKGSKEAGEIWGKHISDFKNIKQEDICAIASVPKWMTKSPGAKYVIRNSILLFESSIPVFIDWEEKFAISNHISTYPTILIIRDVNNQIVEIGRVSGEFNRNRWRKIRNLL